MQRGSVISQLILSKIIEERNAILDMHFSAEFFPQSLELLKKQYPALNQAELTSILMLVLDSMQIDNNDSVELVATVPISFGTKVKRINNVILDLIDNAQKSIIITGYSISSFVDELIDRIISKSEKGVLVKVYLNDLQQQRYVDKLIRCKNKFLTIYNYSNSNDEMAALHAKIVSIDGIQTVVSSANLSYHGLSENIELGCLIYSEKFAKELSELFKTLLFSKVIFEV